MKESTKESIVYFKIFMNRGHAWFSECKNALVIATAFKLLGVSVYIAILLGFCALILFYVVGKIDYKHGIWLKENEINTREMNPYFKNLENNIQNKSKQLTFK